MTPAHHVCQCIYTSFVTCVKYQNVISNIVHAYCLMITTIVNAPTLQTADVITCSTSPLRSQRKTLVTRGDLLGICIGCILILMSPTHTQRARVLTNYQL